MLFWRLYLEVCWYSLKRCTFPFLIIFVWISLMAFTEESFQLKRCPSTWAQSVALNPVISSRWDRICSQRVTSFLSYFLCKLMIENRITLCIVSNVRGAEPTIFKTATSIFSFWLRFKELNLCHLPYPNCNLAPAMKELRIPFYKI